MRFNINTLCVGLISWIIILGTSANLSGSEKAEVLNPWVALEPGLDLGTFVASQKSIAGDSLIRVLRIDPGKFQFRLLNASAASNGKRLSGKNWAKQNGLVAVINASLYQTDNKTSVSLMQTIGHVNNTWFSKDRAVLAFDAKRSGLPAVQILDRDCQDVDQLRKNYHTLIQSIRMISCDGENTWEPQDKVWSTAAIGADSSGNLLFIHVRSPYSTHDLIDILMQLPIHLKRAMYVEGGPQAQLYIQSGSQEFEFVGSYSSRFNANDVNTLAWPIPNVVGIVRKTTSR